MQATNARNMSMQRSRRSTAGPTENGGKPRLAFFLSSFLALALLLTGSLGCGPTPQSDGGQNSSVSASGELPEITDELIHERINDAYVKDVPPMEGTGEPINWSFDHDEPKEITVIEKNVDGTRAAIVLDVKTGSSPRARNQRRLAGQIRTEWELQTGWVLRKWEIVNTENISMKYQDLPKPPAQNSNR